MCWSLSPLFILSFLLVLALGLYFIFSCLVCLSLSLHWVVLVLFFRFLQLLIPPLLRVVLFSSRLPVFHTTSTSSLLPLPRSFRIPFIRGWANSSVMFFFFCLLLPAIRVPLSCPLAIVFRSRSFFAAPTSVRSRPFLLSFPSGYSVFLSTVLGDSCDPPLKLLSYGCVRCVAWHHRNLWLVCPHSLT